MKRLLVLISTILMFSCSSDDNLPEGMCNGVIRIYDVNGDLMDAVPVEYYCSECGTHIYWECPEPGTCGEYFNIVNGLFECD